MEAQFGPEDFENPEEALSKSERIKRKFKDYPGQQRTHQKDAIRGRFLHALRGGFTNTLEDITGKYDADIVAINDPTLYRLRAAAFVHMNQFEEADKYMKNITCLSSEDITAIGLMRYKQGIVTGNKEYFDRAKNYLEDVSETIVPITLARGSIYAQEPPVNRYELRKILAPIIGVSDYANALLGVVNFNEGFFDEALQQFNLSVLLGHHERDAPWRLRGMCCRIHMCQEPEVFSEIPSFIAETGYEVSEDELLGELCKEQMPIPLYSPSNKTIISFLLPN